MLIRVRVPAVLREEPQFRLLFGSQVLSVFGDRVTSIAVPFAVLAVGGGVGDVALVSAAQFLPFVLLALPAGVWADRWDRKRILIASDVVRLLTHPAATTTSFVTSLREGWHEVRSRPWVLGYLGGFSVYHAVTLPAIFVVGPVLMAEEYAGARSWALITALFGVGNILGDVLLLVWRPRHALRVGALMMVGASCQAAIMGSRLPDWRIGLLELLTGVCVTGMFTLWETSLGEHVPSAALSRVSSYDYLASTGVIPLGNLLVGLAAASFGLFPSLWGMTAISIVVALLVLRMPSVRNLPRGALASGS